VQWKPEQSKRIAAALRNLTKNKQGSYLGDGQNFVSLLVLTHVGAGEADEAVKWFAGLSPNMQSQLKKPHDSMPVFPLLKRAIGDASPANLQQRIAFVRDAFRILAKNRWYQWELQHRDAATRHNIPIFDRVVGSGLLTRDELVEHGPAFAGPMDDGGTVKAALAAWLQKEKQPEKAAALWQAAVAAAPDKKAQQADYWRWGLAESLAASGKKGEAIAAAAEIDENRIDPRHRVIFKQFRSALSPAGAAAGGPAK
jgi:hypothetical protein